MKSKILLLAAAVVIPSLCRALPPESDFKRLTSTRTKRLTGCAVSGVTGDVTLKVSLNSRRPYVELPNSLKKEGLAVGSRGLKFAACGTSDVDPTKTVLFLKTAITDTTATEVELVLSDFEDQGQVGSACGSVRPWSGNFIYKTVGSHHFTDVRRNTIGLIMTFGANVPIVSCIDIIARDGTKVGDFGFYARGAGWYARYYGGIGCGDTINGATLAGRARSAAGTDSIYARIGSVCYGPISASRCVGSKAC